MIKDLEKGGLIFDFCLCQKQQILGKISWRRPEAQENTKPKTVIAGGENPMKEQSYPWSKFEAMYGHA